MRFGKQKRTDGGRNWGRSGPVLAVLALLLAVGAPSGCSDNPDTPILTAPGGRGTIAGTLAFAGKTEPPLPVGRILALQNENPECESRFTAIAVLGTLNDFSLERAPEFLMNQVVPCVWVLETHLDQGLLELKFVTGDANTGPGPVNFDQPGDYGNIGPNSGSDPLEGSLDNPANGPDGNLSMTVPKAGDWTFVLNEATNPATYRITQDPLIIQSDPTDGSFRIPNLPVGAYDVSITAEGFLPRKIRGVEVKPNQVADLGTVNMEVASGRLSGVVEFADDPDPRPTATAAIRESGTALVIQSVETDSAFVFTGLDTGTYDVEVKAPGYLTAVVTGIEYTNGEEKELDPIVLQPGCVSEFSTIQLAGEFTSWDLGAAPYMTPGDGCTWTDTLDVEPGTYLFKFVTDGAFDSPLDYGGDESQTLALPGTYPVTAVSGQGTAIKVSVLTGGTYVFVLDETVPQFTATLLGQTVQGAITGTVAFTGFDSPPYPVASVDLLEAGGTTPLVTQTTDPNTGTFRFDGVPDGTYDLRVTAACFAAAVRTGIAVSGAEVNVGAILLAEGTSAFTTVQLAGDFTSWDLTQAPFLTHLSDCTWADTLVVPAGTYNMKFVTDGAFDTPPDYGGDESQTLTLPGEYAVRTASGPGSAIKVEVTEESTFVFTLDERAQKFRAEILSGAPRLR